MLVWLNGPFGVGKTTTANAIVRASPGYRVFDPEWVGYMVRENLADVAVDDFQDLPPWRALVPPVATEIARFTASPLVAVQTVMVERYWNELHAGFDRLDARVVHVLLDCEERALRERIATDDVESAAAGWRLDHVAAYLAARDWMRAAADVVVDVTATPPTHVASAILDSLGSEHAIGE